MEQLLTQFGFTPLEIIVYKALLDLGGAKVSEIANKTGLKRTSCQEYVRSLEERGFVNSSKLGNKYFYQTEDPDRLRQIINERQFIVDRLIPALREEEKDERWEAHTLTLDDVRLKFKRAQKRNAPIVKFGARQNGGAVVNGEKILLFSQNAEIPAIEITSKNIAQFHLGLLNTQNKID